MRRNSPFCPFDLLTLLVCMLPLSSAFAQYNPIEFISEGNNSRRGDGESTSAALSMSTDGRFVAFQSAAENLVSGDNNDVMDIFLHDRDAADLSKLTIISNDRNGTSSDGASMNPSVSADGQFVAFESVAGDLVSTDNNDVSDIFLYDTSTETTTRVSVTTGGVQADGASFNPQISSDGNFIVFESDATNLVVGDSNDVRDIFLHNRTTGETTRVSVSTISVQADEDCFDPSINSDGTVIAFESLATNLTSQNADGLSDIYIRNTTAGTTVLASTNLSGFPSDGDSYDPFVSDDGTLVSFSSDATNLISGDNNEQRDVFLYTIADASTIRVSGDINRSNGDANNSAISGDNAYVVFESESEEITSGDNNEAADVFAYVVSSGTIVRISVQETGQRIAADSTTPTVNTNGQFIAYQSLDDFFVRDRNGFSDVFLVDTQCLLAPAGVTPQDQDSDGTDDCADACPTDPDKIEEGLCGCGVADTDTDGDGTPDCNDECPSDPDKIVEGDCGCGVSDVDGNGNGVSDCLEFTEDTVPRRPTLFFRKARRILRVIIPVKIKGFRYETVVRKGKRTIRRRITPRARPLIPLRRVRGEIKVKYRVLLIDGGTSQFSKVTRLDIPPKVAN